MDLKNAYPHRGAKSGLRYAFRQLDADLRCDGVVSGAVITGALIADDLAGPGHDVVVLSARKLLEPER